MNSLETPPAQIGNRLDNVLVDRASFYLDSSITIFSDVPSYVAILERGGISMRAICFMTDRKLFFSYGIKDKVKGKIKHKASIRHTYRKILLIRGEKIYRSIGYTLGYDYDSIVGFLGDRFTIDSPFAVNLIFMLNTCYHLPILDIPMRHNIDRYNQKIRYEEL